LNRVHISSELISVLNVLSQEYDTEVAGYLVGSIVNGNIHLEDILIPEQDTSQTSVSINPQQMLQLRREYPDKCSRIIGHWHSHHSMGCFWSKTDEENMEQIADPRKLFVFIVSSKGKHLIRIEMREPIHISLDKVGYEIYSEKLTAVRQKVDKIIEENEKRKAEESLLETGLTDESDDSGEEEDRGEESEESEEENEQRHDIFY